MELVEYFLTFHVVFEQYISFVMQFDVCGDRISKLVVVLGSGSLGLGF